MDLFIQVLGFKNTYIWLKDDNPSLKKRGNIRLTKALNANSKVTLLYFTDIILSFKTFYDRALKLIISIINFFKLRNY